LSFGSKFWQCKIADMCTPVASEHLNSTHLSNSYSNQLFYLAGKIVYTGEVMFRCWELWWLRSSFVIVNL